MAEEWEKLRKVLSLCLLLRRYETSCFFFFVFFCCCCFFFTFDILVVQGDWNAKVGKDAQADWGEVCGPYCNVKTNERGLRLLEFATLNNLVLTNTLGPHKPSRRWTWHSPDGKHHNQIDYILVKKRFRSGVNIHRTRSFP